MEIDESSSGAIEQILPTTNEEEMKNLMKDLDREQAYREHKCWRQWITVLVSTVFVLFQLYATLSGHVTAQVLRASHLAFVQLLAFFLFPASKKMPKNTLPWYDVLLGLTGAACWLYIVINFQMYAHGLPNTLVSRSGNNTVLDVVIGIIGILILFESCRRIVGLPIMLIAACFVIYAFAGKYLPGFLHHRGYSLQRVVCHLFYNTEGIMGTPIGACSTFIFLFILFGALLEKTGIGQFFIDLCNAIAGGASGGPAKVAVLSSALLGTVSGSSVSNTVGSGSFTIPMMKKLGYKGEFAGAVEAAASTGGQLMPPIMGAAAFLMAESIGVPYVTIVKAAIIPAILYFTGIFITVHLEAKKLGLKGLPREQLPKVGPLLLKSYMILPLIVIIVFLCLGKTAVFAALMGIVACLIIGIVTSVVDLAMGRKPTFGTKDIIDVICSSARNIISVAIACGMAGIIIGIVTLTGVGLKLGAGLVTLAHGKLFWTLFLTMIASIILGMGAPTTANYLITSTITAGAIITCLYGQGSEIENVMKLPAHMFAFYFGIIADVTPPVALAAIAGAAIAKAKPMKTAVNATKLAVGAFIIPYMFVYNPKMLMINSSWASVFGIIATALIGMFGISVALEGYGFNFTGLFHSSGKSKALILSFDLLERLLFAAAGLLCVIPETRTDIIGISMMVILIAYQIIVKRIKTNKNIER